MAVILTGKPVADALSADTARRAEYGKQYGVCVPAKFFKSQFFSPAFISDRVFPIVYFLFRSALFRYRKSEL